MLKGGGRGGIPPEGFRGVGDHDDAQLDALADGKGQILVAVAKICKKAAKTQSEKTTAIKASKGFYENVKWFTERAQRFLCLHQLQSVQGVWSLALQRDQQVEQTLSRHSRGQTGAGAGLKGGEKAGEV